METEGLGWDGLHKEKRIGVTRCRDGLLSYEPGRMNGTGVVSIFITFKKKIKRIRTRVFLHLYREAALRSFASKVGASSHPPPVRGN